MPIKSDFVLQKIIDTFGNLRGPGAYMVPKKIDISDLIYFFSWDRIPLNSAQRILGCIDNIKPTEVRWADTAPLLDRASLHTKINHTYCLVSPKLISGCSVYNGLTLGSYTEPAQSAVKSLSGYRFIENPLFVKHVHVDANGGASHHNSLYGVKNKRLFSYDVHPHPLLVSPPRQMEEKYNFIVNNAIEVQRAKNGKWHVEISINKNFTFEIPAYPETLKDLFFSREKNQRKAPLLNRVSAYERKINDPTPEYIVVKRHLRGKYLFTYLGYPCTIVPSADDMHEQAVNNRSSKKVQELIEVIESLPENTDISNF